MNGTREKEREREKREQMAKNWLRLCARIHGHIITRALRNERRREMLTKHLKFIANSY